MLRVGTFLCAVAWALPSYAFFEPTITGADMAGMEVTATFADSSTEIITWVTTSAVCGADGEGCSGEAAGTSWTLAQRGFTLGNLVGGSVLGVWTLTSNPGMLSDSTTIATLVINALVADVVFDIVGPNAPELTPASSLGRPFLADPSSGPLPATAVYTDPVSAPDIFGTLTLTWDTTAGLFVAGSELRFLADTDLQTPEPGTLLLLGAALAGLSLRRRLEKCPAGNTPKKRGDCR